MRWPLDMVIFPVYFLFVLPIAVWDLLPESINLFIIVGLGYLIIYLQNLFLRDVMNEPKYVEADAANNIEGTHWDSLSTTVQTALVLDIMFWILADFQWVSIPVSIFWTYMAGAVLLIIYGVAGCLKDNEKTARCVEMEHFTFGAVQLWKI